MVDLKVLQYHDGDFWTLTRSTAQAALSSSSPRGSGVEFVKTHISKAIFDKDIPAPRDVILICLIDTCDVFRFMFQLDDETEERIDFICKMDLIGRSIAAAVSHNLAGPLLRRSALAKDIPTVSLRKLLLNRHIRDGNIPALFADLAQQLWSGVPDQASLCQAHGLSGGPRNKSLGAPAGAHVPEGQRLFC